MQKYRNGDTNLNVRCSDPAKQMSEEKEQNALLDNLPCGAGLYEFDGKKINAIHLNKRYWELVGRDKRDGDDISVLDAIHADDRNIIVQEVRSAIRQNRSAEADCRIRFGSSGYRPFHISARITPAAAGKYLLYASYTPISNQAMSIQEMIPVALSTMMSASDDLSFVKDKNRHYICCSRSAARVLGLASERDIIGKNDCELFDSDIARLYAEEDEKIFRTGEPVLDRILKMPLKGGRVLVLSASKYPILDASGGAIGIYGISRDITVQKEKEKQLELLTSSIPGGLAVYSITKDGISMRYFNDGFYNFSGYSREDYAKIVAADPLAFVFDEDKPEIRAMIKDFADKPDGHVNGCLYRCHTKDGGYRWMSMKSVLSRLGGDRSAVNIVQIDITEQKKAEELQKDLLDNLPCGAGLYHFDGSKLTVVHVNKRYQEMVGRSINTANTPSVLGVVHPDDIGRIKSLMGADSGDSSCDIRIRHSDGSYHPYRINSRLADRGNGTWDSYVTFLPLPEDELSMQEMMPFIFPAIMQSSTDITFAKDKDFRYLCCSRAYAKMIGMEDEGKVVGKTDYELFEKKTADRYRQDDIDLIASGEPLIDITETIPTKAGLPYYSRTSKYVLHDTMGNVLGIYGIGRDITERRETYDRLKVLTESIPGGIAVFNCVPGRFDLAYFNDGFSALFGYTHEEFEQHGKEAAEKLIFDDDRAVLAAQIQALMTDGTQINCIHRILTKDGGLRWVCNRADVTDRVGDSVIVSAVLLDVTELQEEKERLRLNEEEYRLAAEHSRQTICRYNIAERTLSITAEAAKRLELPECIPDIPYGRVKLGEISPDTAEVYIAFYEAIMRGEKEQTVIFKKLLPTGWRWVSAHATTVFDSLGKPVTAIVTYIDVTEQQEKEAVYKKWQQGLRDREPFSYTLYCCNLNKDDAEDSVEGMLLGDLKSGENKASFNERIRDFAENFVIEEDRKAYIECLNADTLLAGYYRGKRSMTFDFRGRLPSGVVHWLRLTVELVEYPNSTDVQAYLMYENINEKKVEELETKLQAETDPLTGLLNRKTFKEMMNRAIARTKPGALCALFLLDMDGFKLINDSFGHSVGDQVLIDAGQAIRSVLRDGDLACRMGGDEFLVGLCDMPGRDAVLKRARELCALTHKVFNLDVRMSISLGIAVSPGDGSGFDELYLKADKALYYVKEHGKDSCAFYSGDMSRTSDERHEDGETAPTLNAPGTKRKMLIVDDSKAALALLKGILENDFTVETAESGSEALIKLRRAGTGISVVLLDLMMPGMDGFSVLEKIQDSAEMQMIPVIVVSGDDDRETNLRAIRAGAADFITKPVDADLLRIRVASAVSKAESERLRMQNHYLSLQKYEMEKIRSILEDEGTVIVEYDPASGAVRCERELARRLGGSFDGRPLRDVLTEDDIASRADVQRLWEMISSLREDAGRKSAKTVVKLKIRSGAEHSFRVKALKCADELIPGDKLLLAFTDLDC